MLHYIPHHPVRKASSTTPIRIVYNCSCRRSTQPSLNDCLEMSPSFLTDLRGILLRFCICMPLESLQTSKRPFYMFDWMKVIMIVLVFCGYQFHLTRTVNLQLVVSKLSCLAPQVHHLCSVLHYIITLIFTTHQQHMI